MKNIVEKWFDILELPSEWKQDVLSYCDKTDIAEIESHDDPYLWLFEQEDKLLSLVYVIYKCESFADYSHSKGIGDDVIIPTLSELKRYALECYKLTGKIGLIHSKWLGKILNGKIYRLGRLEFEMRDAMHSYEPMGLTKGENVIGVHIPDNGGPFTPEVCDEAYEKAKSFFAKHFPEFQYKHYVCNSWLLDRTLKKFLKSESNIVKFMDSFEEVATKEVYSAFTYLFGMGTEAKDLKNFTPTTSLQKGIIEHIENGGKLYSTFGVKK